MTEKQCLLILLEVHLSDSKFDKILVLEFYV